MGTQAVGHPYDLFLDRFKPKKDIFGDFADEYLVEAWNLVQWWFKDCLWK